MASEDWEQAFELSFADRAADRGISDPAVHNILRGSILVRTVMLLEAAGKNSGSDEQDALREMRNAIAHNGFDLSQNRNSASFSLVQSYLADLKAGSVPSANPNPLSEFFSLSRTTIVFDQGDVSEPCRQILMKYI